MKTPFTSEQFFSVFESYNSSVFPAQIILLLMGITALYFVITSRPVNHQFVTGLLGLIWIWTGAVYHIAFFSPLNPVAVAFGSLFILQGILLLIETFKNKKPEFVNHTNLKGFIAKSLIVFGLIIYPVISYFLEGSLPKVISFGLPCPTTIVTFGFIMLADKSISKYLLIIPSLWAIMVIPVASNFGIYQDFMLIISAVIANIYILRSRRKVVSVSG